MRRFIFICAAVAGFASAAPALINPALQPVDLSDRHAHVVIGEFTKVDQEAGTAGMRITRSLKGDFKKGEEITLRFEDTAKAALREAQGQFGGGAPVVAWIEKQRRSRTNDEVMLYADSFYLGQAKKGQPWVMKQTDAQLADTEGAAIPSLAGTWNGSTRMLIRLLEDAEKGRAYFPRYGYARFKPDILLDQLEDHPARGVALYDIDGDDDLDVYVCSPGGDRIYLQMEPLVFVDATDWAALERASRSCSFADADGDGRADLPADGMIFRGFMHDGRLIFEQTEWLPEEADEDVLMSAFVELNGDGYPDVIVSRRDGGLRAYLNPGKTGGPFEHATEKLGLDRPEAGAGSTGFFAAGDWSDNGRTDLFLAAGEGFLLLQNKHGRFEPLAHGIKFNFLSGEADEPGLTGAGFFASITDPRRLDLVIPTQDGWRVIENRDDKPVDVTEWGNETSEGSHLHLASFPEDLNLDGHMDFYTVSRAENGHNRYLINRGNGSFMLAEIHSRYGRMFPGPAHMLGGWGAATGDVDGDLAPDLLIANSQGRISVLLNETVELRKPSESALADEQVLQQVRMLEVRLKPGPGVVGARLLLLDEEGEIVARREGGANMSGGSRGPDRFTMAERQPGTYTLAVRFSDGREGKWKVDLASQQSAQLEIAPPAK